LPSLKQPQKYEWADQHGEIVDLEKPRYNSRQIILDAWIETTAGKLDFVEKINAFFALLRRPGLRQMAAFISPDSPLVYMVYTKDGIEVAKKWRDVQMYGTFQIKLEEPEPVKKVIRFTGTQPIITFRSADAFNIYWGDGRTNYDVCYDAGDTARHTYATAGTYYICFTGNIDSLTTFSTNGTVIFS
jgi:hypothetical protein